MNIAIIIGIASILASIIVIATFVNTIMKQEREKGAMLEKNTSLATKVSELEHTIKAHEIEIHKNDVSHADIARVLQGLENIVQEMRADLRELKDKFDAFIKG